MIKNKKIIISFFLIYIIIGSTLSILNGVSHDQYHEQLNWDINFQAIKGIIYGLNNYDILKNYIDRYHGIAFHFISQPFQLILTNFVSEINQTTNIGGIYISRHFPNFVIFSISGFFFFLICKKISNNFNYSLVCTTLYLTYPYLFGHAQINAKDIPFLSFWIIATYYLFTFIENFKNYKRIALKKILIFSFVTGFLISIRISGSLIFLEYLICLLVFLNLNNASLSNFLKKNFYFFFYFIIFTAIFVYLLNPILWLNPLEIFNSFEWMSKYYHDTCTLTLGDCMRARNLPSSYIFIWMFFKLPIIILLGILLFPLIENKILNNKLNSIYYTTILLTVLVIIFVLILKKVSLYDELRHIMFLLPLIFMVALYNIYIFNKKFFYFLSFFTILFFVFENFSLKKYQYTWLNSFAKFTTIEKNFEIDYWGVSNKNLQKQISIYSENQNLSKNICIYGDLYSDIFLKNLDYTCFGSYSQIDSIKEKPFFAYQNVRNLKRSNPKDCRLIYSEKYSYTFSSKDIIVGKLWLCN